jgi:predicted dehydrogenase
MNISSSKAGISRRRFLAATGLALAVPTILPASVFGQNAPSKRITMGVVGWGMQAPGNTGNFMNLPDCQVIASCNINTAHLAASVRAINGHYKNEDCKTYKDYREMMARPDIDTVMIAVPDHWHALIATEAARNRKDIYGEKPLARTIAEQQAMVKAVQENKRVWQTGSWQRSEKNFHYGAEVVRNGLIGKITRVEVGLPSGHADFAGTGRTLMEKLSKLPNPPKSLGEVVPGTPAWEAALGTPPEALDYPLWLGPSRLEPYIEARVYQNWRWNYNTGGGQLLDWIGHHGDIAHWGLGNDDTIGPLEIEGQGEFPAKDAIWNTATKYRLTAKYPNDVTMIIAGGHGDIRGGTKWIGTDGWVWVDRGNGFESSNKALEDTRSLPEEQRKVKLIKTVSHYRDFIDCVKSRQRTVTPVEVAHHSAIPGHLGLISMLVGRKLKWNAAEEVIVGDAEASKLLSRPYRSPWKLA